MVKTKSVYDKEVIKEISKPLAKKALITSVLFTVALWCLGIFFLITSILEFEERGVFNIVVACITIVFSGYPLYKAIKQNKESLKTAIADMGIDKSSIEINLTVREKRIEVTSDEEKLHIGICLKIIVDGDVSGSIVLLIDDMGSLPSEANVKLISTTSALLARQLES